MYESQVGRDTGGHSFSHAEGQIPKAALLYVSGIPLSTGGSLLHLRQPVLALELLEGCSLGTSLPTHLPFCAV